MNILPPEINFSFWDEGKSIESTGSLHTACWHPHCQNILHVATLERQRKHELSVGAGRILSLVDQGDVDFNHDSGDMCLKFHVLHDSLLDQFLLISKVSCFFSGERDSLNN